MSVLKLNQIQTANGVIMANLNSSGANIGFQLASSLAPAFSAYKLGSSQTSFSNSTGTKVILDGEIFDTANCFDSTTNYRFTPNVAGYYQIQGCIESNWLVSQYSFYKASIYKNGSEYVRWQLNGTTGTYNYPAFNVSSIIYFNGSTDYVELYVYSTGGNTPAYDQGSYATYFTGAFIRSA
jgi:hypothetical protein